MDPALTLTDLRRHYGDVRAVEGVSLSVAVGERFALLGPSGSGKTTVLRLIAGFDAPSGGSVSLHGQVVDGQPPERRNVGVVFQDYALFPHRSVAQNIEFGLRMRSLDRRTRRARVAEMLSLVGLTPEAGRRPRQLSGGQQQRVALARALAPSPRLLLLDEPLANLDRRLRESLRRELVAITGAVGVTSVLVTHDQEEALGFADRVGVLRDGRIAQTGTPAEVWRAPVDAFVATFLGDMNLLPVQACVDGRVRVAGVDGLLATEGLPCTAAGPPSPGDATVVACLRPEALTVVVDPGGPGRVREVAYAGGSATVTVDIGDHVVAVKVPQPDGTPVAATGDAVWIRPAVSRVRLLDANGTGA